MNYSQQKSLYESIMKEVAETIKKSLNENVLNEAFGGSISKKKVIRIGERMYK